MNTGAANDNSDGVVVHPSNLKNDGRKLSGGKNFSY